MKIRKVVTIAALLLTMPGCGWLMGDDGVFRDRGNDYRRARIEPPLKIPAGLDEEAIDDSYAIPPITDNTQLHGEFMLPRPEPMEEDADRDAVVISKFGDTQWILVNGSAGQVWPRLRTFFSLNGIELLRADAANGIMETAWLQPEGSPKERYRLRIDQGVQRETSEVYVTQADLRAGEDRWPEHSSDQAREDVMVKALAQYLADSASAASVSMLAQRALDASGKVTIEQPAGMEPYLLLELGFERGWASVAKAMEKAGFNVTDRDRSQGLYYASYQLKETDDGEVAKESGWFSGWFGGGDDENSAAAAYVVKVSQFNPAQLRITVERQDSQPMGEREAERLLKLIKRYLS